MYENMIQRTNGNEESILTVKFVRIFK